MSQYDRTWATEGHRYWSPDTTDGVLAVQHEWESHCRRMLAARVARWLVATSCLVVAAATLAVLLIYGAP